jgi:hypothetical protein
MRPDYDAPFTLEVDASQYAIGAVLSQRNNKGRLQPIGFFSKTLIPAERNYDVYDRELLALMKGLRHWQHLLLGAKHPTKVFTDHENLTKFREPQNIGRRVARYVATLAEYNMIIQHQPGMANKVADALSRPPGTDEGSQDNQQVTVLPSHLFCRASTATSLLDRVLDHQGQSRQGMMEWKSEHTLVEQNGVWTKGGKIVVPDNLLLCREIYEEVHASPLAGHPGIQKTVSITTQQFWWPEMKQDLTEYVKGCGTCQATKPSRFKHGTPLFPITPDPVVQPFSTIVLDFIVDLPKSDRFDSILTVTDHDVSKAAFFIPCHKTATGEHIAKLYATHIFPHFGVPRKVISDRDTRFTSHFSQELCQLLGVTSNMSTAYHPQMDGQSERTNQWLEQYLQIYVNHSQDNWAGLLPLAQFVHNAWPSLTTGLSPFELLIGFIPSSGPAHTITSPMPTLESRKQGLKQL